MKKITLLVVLIAFKSFAQVEVVSNFIWGVSAKVNNKIVFSRSTPEFGAEIWCSDGTTDGTMILKDINTGVASSNPGSFTLIDGIVYFQANADQVWRTDGTTLGTYSIVNNIEVTNPTNFIKAGQFIFFSEGMAGTSCCHSLWKTLTTSNSESLVTPTTTFFDINGIFELDSDEVLFNAKTSSGWAIWRSNGVVNELVRDINLGTNSLDIPQMRLAEKIEGVNYFNGFSSEFGGELWKTDGTLTGTVLVKDIYTANSNPFSNLSSSSPTKFTKLGASIYFSARDISNGYELWKTDGTDAGTLMVKDINVGNNSNSGIDSLTPSSSLLYFTQSNSENPGSTQIWKSDGTESGTTVVTDLANSYINNTELFYHNGVIYFSLFQPATGSELWKLDTTTDTVSLLADIAVGTTSSDPTDFFEWNGFIYFTASSDGTFGGFKTYRIAEQSLSNAEISKLATTIYPNPTQDFLTVALETESDFTVEIFDLTGKKVAQFNNQKRINISQLELGIYLVKITLAKSYQSTIHRIIKK